MVEILSDFSGEWRFDPAHTRIGFSTRHAMVTKVRGAFNELRAPSTSMPKTLSSRRHG